MLVLISKPEGSIGGHSRQITGLLACASHIYRNYDVNIDV